MELQQEHEKTCTAGIWVGHSSHVTNAHVINFAEKSLNAEGGACLGVICGAVVAQEARVCGVVADDEVGTVVKSGITVAAEAKLVLVTLSVALLYRKFDTR